jgi:hypothetical protein
MTLEYASVQPKGFKNQIENVAIVGVSCITEFLGGDPIVDLPL